MSLEVDLTKFSDQEVGGIPLLFDNPQAALADWSAKINFYLIQAKADEDHLEQLIKNQKNQTTKKRLERTLFAKKKHREAIIKILSPVIKQNENIKNLEAHLFKQFNSSLEITQYHENLFRDWSWQTSENEEHFKLIEETITDTNLKKLLVLGGGACRLPYDLHTKLETQATLALDINPLLLLTAQKMVNGKIVNLYEFPQNPIEENKFSVKNQLKAPHKVANFQLAFADALKAPIQDESFDTVFTPWFIDIIPEDIENLTQKINHILPEGGRWINFGPLGLDHKDYTLNYSQEEIREILIMNGFEIVSENTKVVPYLHSPNAGGKRFENVWCFEAIKKQICERPQVHKTYPEWITNTKAIIPVKDDFQLLSGSHELYALILKAINGTRTIEQIAEAFGNQFNLKKEQALPTVQNFLIKVYEQIEKANPTSRN